MATRLSRIILAALLLLLPGGGHAEEHFPGTDWDQLPAGSGGWSAATLAKAEAWSRLIEDEPELSTAEQLSANGANGTPFALDEPGFAAPRGEALRWRISEGGDQMLHPVHVHGCQFRIVSQHGQPPEAYRAGWKDIAPISAGDVSEILVSFPYPARTRLTWRTATSWNTKIQE